MKLREKILAIIYHESDVDKVLQAVIDELPEEYKTVKPETIVYDQGWNSYRIELLKRLKP